MLKYQQDLIRIGSYTVREIDRPYSLNDTWEVSAQNLYQLLKDAMRKRNRIMTMVYGYYFGELIQFSVTPKEKWNEFVRDNSIPSNYYLYQGMTRLYQLFRRDPSQIYRTTTLTFNIVSRFKIAEYQELLQYNQDLDDFTDSLTMS